ncbi:glycosyltransferase family 4 protein [uncultured Chloroflexus sp.]|uniref:glycosyltransferase family 4 protein n=1 Tax=uncultured Chloroflexus sp. TaxID=214040 RepID=UPI00260D21DB|nr:glycosyltransferase family 4 protein [uncultured Chloroflexus sp.]
MKVLFVSLELYNPAHLGGIQRFNQRVVRALTELGCEVRTIALWDRAEDTRAALTLHFPGRRRKIWTTLKYIEQVTSFDPDIVLFGHVLLAPLAALGRWLRSKGKQALFVHGYEVWSLPFRDVSMLERLIVRRSFDRIIPVSRTTRDRMDQVYRLGLDRYRILPNAIDIPETSQMNAPLDRQSDHIMLTVARLDDHSRKKGIDQVIRALSNICHRFPLAHYVIVGDGPLKRELEELAIACGVREHVTFTGRIPDWDLIDLYRRADAFVMPSKQEGFGIVYLEAWIHGVPIIVGKDDAGAELVTHRENGLVVDPESIDDIAQAINWLFDNPEDARRLGLAGRDTVRQQYLHEHFRNRLAEILEELCVG